MAQQQLNLSGEQADSLLDVLSDHIDGSGVFITQDNDRYVYVAFSMSTITIKPSGQTEEN